MHGPRLSKLVGALRSVPIALLGVGLAASALQASCNGEDNANPDWEPDASGFDVQVRDVSLDSPRDRADGMSYGEGYRPPEPDAHASCVSSTVTYPPAPGCPAGNHTWACWAPTPVTGPFGSQYSLVTLCGDGVVVDEHTHLMWAANVEQGMFTWVEAAAGCKTSRRAGFSDWRLPSSNELMSIVDYGSTTSALDTDVFHGPAGPAWSSTPFAQQSGNAWQLDASGGVYAQEVSTSAYVRCVR